MVARGGTAKVLVVVFDLSLDTGDEVTEVGGGFVLIVVSAFSIKSSSTDREADLALVGVNVDDLDTNALAVLEFVAGVLDVFRGDFGDVNQTFDACFQLNKRTEVGELLDQTIPGGTRTVFGGNGVFPGVRGQFFEVL